MRLEHRVGQLLMIGLPAGEVDAETARVLEDIQPGGILLTRRNILASSQVLDLTLSLRSILTVPPLIAVDQEGGYVDRLKSIYAPMPSGDLLRAAKDASAAARMGEITAEALRTLGLNMNLAPVLDIAFDDTVENGLTGRYLGDEPAEVVRLSGAYLEGLQRGGVVGVGKHFPGLGAATSDPHSQLPRIERSREELLRHDLVPYLELFTKINARLNAVMLAHAHYPAIDGPAPLPATLSKNIATGLLREEMSFKGLALTDDLEMGAVVSARDPAEAAVMSIEAGADVVMVGSSLEGATRAWEAMAQAAREGRITLQRIGRSFDNIARVKSMLSPPYPHSEMSISRLRERIGELNLLLQHAR